MEYHSAASEAASQSAKCKYQSAKCPEEESGVKAEAAERSNVARTTILHTCGTDPKEDGPNRQPAARGPSRHLHRQQGGQSGGDSGIQCRVQRGRQRGRQSRT